MVLLKIMTVIQDAMCGDVGLMLGDIEICEMLETVLTTSCQMRLSGMSSTGLSWASNVNAFHQKSLDDLQRELCISS